MKIEIRLSTGEKMVFVDGQCVSDDPVSWWKLTKTDLGRMFAAAEGSKQPLQAGA